MDFASNLGPSRLSPTSFWWANFFWPGMGWGGRECGGGLEATVMAWGTGIMTGWWDPVSGGVVPIPDISSGIASQLTFPYVCFCFETSVHSSSCFECSFRKGFFQLALISGLEFDLRTGLRDFPPVKIHLRNTNFRISTWRDWLGLFTVVQWKVLKNSPQFRIYSCNIKGVLTLTLCKEVTYTFCSFCYNLRLRMWIFYITKYLLHNGTSLPFFLPLSSCHISILFSSDRWLEGLTKLK